MYAIVFFFTAFLWRDGVVEEISYFSSSFARRWWIGRNKQTNEQLVTHKKKINVKNKFYWNWHNSKKGNNINNKIKWLRIAFFSVSSCASWNLTIHEKKNEWEMYYNLLLFYLAAWGFAPHTGATTKNAI